MQRYTPYPICSSEGQREHYAVRVGGQGGKLVGRHLYLDRDGASHLCGLLQSEYDAGRESMVEA